MAQVSDNEKEAAQRMAESKIQIIGMGHVRRQIEAIAAGAQAITNALNETAARLAIIGQTFCEKCGGELETDAERITDTTNSKRCTQCGEGYFFRADKPPPRTNPAEETCKHGHHTCGECEFEDGRKWKPEPPEKCSSCHKAERMKFSTMCPDCRSQDADEVRRYIQGQGGSH